MIGLTINDKHTYNDFGLLMTSFYIPLPETKVSQIEIPYSNGSIDLTEVTGEPTYKDRSGLKFEFIPEDNTDWEYLERLKTDLSMFLHGKKLTLIPDDDVSYYYMARLEVDAPKEFGAESKIVLSGSAEPFKYDLIASNEAWLWDPFSFIDGVIRDLSNLSVTDGDTVTILGAGISTTPTFIVSSSTNLTVTADDTTYSMASSGTYRFPSLKVGEDDVTLTFGGSGVLSISYRGRYL